VGGQGTLASQSTEPPGFQAPFLAPAKVTRNTIAVTPGAALASTFTATDWSTFAFDPQRSGYNPVETVLTPSTIQSAGGLRRHWSRDLGGPMLAQPTLLSGVTVGSTSMDLVYAATLNGDVYALNAATGAVAWTRKLPAVQSNCSDFPGGVIGVIGTPTLDHANNRMFLVSGDGNLHALNIATGAELSGWPVQILDAANAAPRTFVYGSPTLINSTLYIATASRCDIRPYHGQVVSVSVNTHTVQNRWYPDGATGPDGGGIWGPGGVSATVFKPSAPTDFHLYALTGNAFATPQNGGYAEHVVRLSPTLQPETSNTTTPNVNDADFGATPPLFQPPGCPGLLAAMQKTGKLFIYNRAAIPSGPIQTLQISTSSAYGSFVGQPTYNPVLNRLYLGSPTDSGIYRHGLIALSISSSCSFSLAWQQQVGRNGSSDIPPMSANGVVYYVDGGSSQAFAFDAQTGKQLWTFTTDTSSGVRASPTVVNGQVFIAAYDHKLYAFGL
jgi:outer membrane protein assembly factor BamB